MFATAEFHIQLYALNSLPLRVLPLKEGESHSIMFFKLLLFKRRWHKRSAVTEEFYIQLYALNSLPLRVLPLKEEEMHGRMFLKTPPR